MRRLKIVGIIRCRTFCKTEPGLNDFCQNWNSKVSILACVKKIEGPIKRYGAARFYEVA